MKKKKEINTKKDLLEVLKAIPFKDNEQKKNIVCSLIGHSKIQTLCFGYYNCGRCGDQMGDTMMSVYYGAESAVVIGHNCKTCRKNYKECTWKDKYLVADPFGKPTLKKCLPKGKKK